MPAFSKKGIPILASIVLLTIGVAIIPEIIGEDVKAWCEQNLGPSYKGWLIGFFVVGSAILVYLTTDFGKSEKKAEQTTLTPTELETYRTGIREWLKSRYELRLEQKMAGRLPINLSRLVSTEGTSDFRTSAFEEISEEKIQGKLAELFREAKGRLLILGAPGAGKTTLMLQLALGLLDSEPEAVPVVVNLATWSSEFKIFEDWLKKILPVELGASNALTAKMLVGSHLIFLFDGLDEISEREKRVACLDAITEFGSKAVRENKFRREYVISSRIKEYRATTKDAPVRFQIEVGPLKIEQIEVELVQRDYSEDEDRLLLRALRVDPFLREAAETPFYFNCLQLIFSHGLIPDDLHFQASTCEGRKTEILDRFIGQELKNCKKPETLRWLSFLASRMNGRWPEYSIYKFKKPKYNFIGPTLVRFELRDLQYNWWKWKTWRGWDLLFGQLLGGLVSGLTGALLGGLFYGLSLGLSCGLVFGLTDGLVIGLVIGLLGGLLGGTNHWPIYWGNDRTPKIETRESIRWTLKSFFSLFTLFIEIIAFVLTFMIAFSLHHRPHGQFFVGVGGSVLGLLLLYRFNTRLDALYDFLQENHTSILKIETPYQRFLASAKNLHLSILQHLLLRYQLSKKDLLPPRLVDFLNEMASYQSEREKQKGKPKPRRFTTADVHLLESDGASWRFRHRLIQEWFAGKWEEPGQVK